jgi:hypothetical protein
MSSVQEITEAASKLSERSRAELALAILDTLPPAAMREDEIVAEAMLRDAQLESGSAVEISHAEYRRRLTRRE